MYMTTNLEPVKWLMLKLEARLKGVQWVCIGSYKRVAALSSNAHLQSKGIGAELCTCRTTATLDFTKLLSVVLGFFLSWHEL